MKKSRVIKNSKGFNIRGTDEYLEKQSRELKIKELKQKKDKISLENIKEYLDLTNDRISEIYDLVKR